MVLLLCAFMCTAQVSPKISKKHFTIDVHQLDKYLKLSNNQKKEVKLITMQFERKQAKSDLYEPGKREYIKRKAVYENLSMMKHILNHEQYRKYLFVLNITNSSYLLAEMKTTPDIHLAESNNVTY